MSSLLPPKLRMSKCKQIQWAHRKTRYHFNMLGLRETLRTLSRCHHFRHQTCTCQMQKHNGHAAGHGINSTCWICTKQCAHWVDVITFAKVKCKTQWAHRRTWYHFNMLDLHETVHTLSRCHHFRHRNCTCQMQNTMGTPQNMVSLQHAGFARSIALNHGLLAEAERGPARALRDPAEPRATLRNPPPPPAPAAPTAAVTQQRQQQQRQQPVTTAAATTAAATTAAATTAAATTAAATTAAATTAAAAVAAAARKSQHKLFWQ